MACTYLFMKYPLQPLALKVSLFKQRQSSLRASYPYSAPCTIGKILLYSLILVPSYLIVVLSHNLMQVCATPTTSLTLHSPIYLKSCLWEREFIEDL